MRRCCAVLLVVLLMLWPAVRVSAAEPAGDGSYTVEVRLEGGTGRAGISSPAVLTLADGVMTATIVWSSPYYEYMKVDGVVYQPLPGQETATFEIPVVLDEEMAVSAQTIAMSQPHEIEYILYFDSSTLKAEGGGLSLGLLLTVAGGCLFAVIVVANWLAKRRRAVSHKRTVK